MQKLKIKIAEFKTRLTSVSKEEPLNKLSLVLILILDLFVLTLLFNGLDEHTRQLITADDYLPGTARTVFIGQDWTPADRIPRLQPLVLSDRNNARYRYESPFDDRKISRMHPSARAFYSRVKRLSQDEPLSALFLTRQKTVEELEKTEEALRRTKIPYDTRLLEKPADTAKPDSQAVAGTAREHMQKIERLTGDLRRIERQLDEHPDIQILWALIQPDDAAREKIVAEFKRFQFWFPLKELAWQLLFLLPIFGIFCAWSNRSVKNENPIQTLISSHLLVIASLPIILKASELVIDLIPKHFFRNLFNLLQALHLMALWHYFVIFGSIAAGLLLVYFVQRKVFNRQKVMQKRLMKGCCTACNKKLPPGSAYCPFCGRVQFIKCDSCGNETPLGGSHCIHCGTSN